MKSSYYAKVFVFEQKSIVITNSFTAFSRPKAICHCINKTCLRRFRAYILCYRRHCFNVYFLFAPYQLTYSLEKFWVFFFQLPQCFLTNSTLAPSIFNFAIGVCLSLLLDEIAKLDISSNRFCFGRSPSLLEFVGCNAFSPFLTGFGLLAYGFADFSKMSNFVALATLFTSCRTGLSLYVWFLDLGRFRRCSLLFVR